MRHFVVYLLDIYFNRNWQFGEAKGTAVHTIGSGFGHADHRSDFGKRNILLAKLQNQQNRFLVFDSSGQSVLRCRDAFAADMAVSGLVVGVFFTAELARNFWLRTSAAAAAQAAGMLGFCFVTLLKKGHILMPYIKISHQITEEKAPYTPLIYSLS